MFRRKPPQRTFKTSLHKRINGRERYRRHRADVNNRVKKKPDPIRTYPVRLSDSTAAFFVPDLKFEREEDRPSPDDHQAWGKLIGEVIAVFVKSKIQK